MRICVARIQRHSHALHSDIGIQLNRQTFEFDLIVVAEDGSLAGGARYLISFGSHANISGVVVQKLKGHVQVNSRCLYRLAVSKIPIIF